MFRVMINTYRADKPLDLVECHPDVKNIKEAKAILKQWMQKGDRAIVLEKKGKITPILIECPDGECVDIFGQLLFD